MQKHPRQMQPRQFAPLLLVSTLTVSMLAAPFSHLAGWTFVLCLALYLVANLSASICVALRERAWMVVELSIVFTILHFSFGAGFAVGLIKFWNRWGKHSSGNRFPSISDVERS